MKKPASRLPHLKEVLFFLAFITTGFVFASDQTKLPDGSLIDISKPCPVCGMKIDPASDNLAAVVFNDGVVVAFDANSDFFKYLLEPDKYKFSRNAIKSLYVKTKDNHNFIDAKIAHYIIGKGSSTDMGAEVTAFAERSAAEKFQKSKPASKILVYSEVTLLDVQPKKKMLKMKEPSGDQSKPKNSHGGH